MKHIYYNLCFFFFFFFFKFVYAETLVQQKSNISGNEAFSLGLSAVRRRDDHLALKYFNIAKNEGKYVNEAKLEILKILSSNPTESIEKIKIILESIEDKKIYGIALIALSRNFHLAQRNQDALELLSTFQNTIKNSQVEQLNEVLYLSAYLHYFEMGDTVHALEELYSIVKGASNQASILIASYSLLSEIYLSANEFYNHPLGCLYLQRASEISRIEARPISHLYENSKCL